MDLAALVNSARRAASADLYAAGQRVVFRVPALVQLLDSAGASAELARALRSRPATESVSVILPPGSGQARVDLGSRQIAIPAALRDAIRAFIEMRGTAKHGAAETAARAGADGSAVSARTVLADALAATFAAVHSRELDRPGRGAARLGATGAGPAHAVDREPLLDSPPDAAAGATRLSAAVGRSGLFFESHLAAWARDALDRQADAMPAALRREAPTLSPERTAAQLDVLTQDSVRLGVTAWAGQAATVELRRESKAEAAADADGAEGPQSAAFSARLDLELERLGPVKVRLRLVGNTIAATVASHHAAAIERELPLLASQFESRSLQPVALQATALS